MKPVCNYCGYLIRNYVGDDRRFFTACCGKNLIVSGCISRPTIIETEVHEACEIDRPSWCPTIASADSNKTEPPQTPSVEEKKEEEEHKPFKDLSYMEKKEVLKKLPRKLSWDEIKEGEDYLIPKIISSPRKIIRVIHKDDNSIRYHEISEISGTEYSYSTTMSQDDVEAVMIVKLHNY